MPRYLVTSALPYANGPIHFGHVIGAYLPADCYVRTLRMLGEDVAFICGADEYGVAITVGADAAGSSYAEYAARWRGEIKTLFDRLDVDFDVWSGTSVSPFHADFALDFFRRLKKGGYLSFEETEQLYCATDERFLADRYVLGECPKCQHPEARGDECPQCGTWLDPLEIVSPRCKLCGNPPEKRSTGHWYIDLAKLRDEHIGAWFEEKREKWKPNVSAFVSNMLAGAERRPITRDLPWGIPLSHADFWTDGEGKPLPGAPTEEEAETGKVLYVWFDAPIGYLSFTREWAEAKGSPELWREYWQGEDTRLVHFIGKDNIPFHCVVFPSMLWGTKAGYTLPWQVPANEFFNLQGKKFNTSSGWTLDLESFFERYDSDAARFHLLASTPETSDSEWRWEEFQGTVNAVLADKIGNLATRVLRFVDKHCEGRIPPMTAEHVEELDQLIFEECGDIADPAEAVLAFRFRRATEILAANATVANVFIDRTAPWGLRKTDPDRAWSVLNTACEWLGWLARWMAPFLPGKAQALWEMLGGEGAVEADGWPGVPVAGSDWRKLGSGRKLGEVSGLFTKISDEEVQAELEALGSLT